MMARIVRHQIRDLEDLAGFDAGSRTGFCESSDSTETVGVSGVGVSEADASGVRLLFGSIKNSFLLIYDYSISFLLK